MVGLLYFSISFPPGKGAPYTATPYSAVQGCFFRLSTWQALAKHLLSTVSVSVAAPVCFCFPIISGATKSDSCNDVTINCSAACRERAAQPSKLDVEVLLRLTSSHPCVPLSPRSLAPSLPPSLPPSLFPHNQCPRPRAPTMPTRVAMTASSESSVAPKPHTLSYAPSARINHCAPHPRP